MQQEGGGSKGTCFSSHCSSPHAGYFRTRLPQEGVCFDLHMAYYIMYRQTGEMTSPCFSRRRRNSLAVSNNVFFHKQVIGAVLLLFKKRFDRKIYLLCDIFPWDLIEAWETKMAANHWRDYCIRKGKG